MNRRDFLKSLGALPLLHLLPASVEAGQKQRCVVLVELKGGNDSLNTLVPYQDAAYYRLRPQLALREQQVLPLGNGMGLHPAMQPLLPLWRNGEMAWIQGVGIPGQNLARSHFTSIHTWDTASEDQHSQQGWLSRVFPEQAQHLQGVVIGDELGPLAGGHFNAVNLHDIDAFAAYISSLPAVPTHSSNPMLAHILATQQRLLNAGAEVSHKLKGNQAIKQQFPKGAFGEGLASIARLILSDFNMPVYKIGLGNFDTHVSQPNLHQKLLGELANGLAAFSKVMQAHGKWGDVMVLSYSEFGRRAAENHNMGTDHGSAAAHFAIGGGVKGGMYGTHPDLDALNEGDVRNSLDFRSLYASLARRWWQRSSPWPVADIPFIA
ncbi:MAG: DUF1501 domain-containing protein [Gammaproteobacteria bacterium]|nr:DUF1501 domain-containing protein [Gammaproteobacteria bacterium]MBU1725674.1 DUF1501 domain-containing protein [Gammaproteobacteria bacterium]MBU2003974.1 DUF1501 domain-containing protein [Gammaproteobacteria bacterium]